MSQHAPQLFIFTNRRYITPNVFSNEMLEEEEEEEEEEGRRRRRRRRREREPCEATKLQRPTNSAEFHQ
jgi:hypothetical protein